MSTPDAISSPAGSPAPAGGAEETAAPTAVSSTYPPLVEFARWAIVNSAFVGGDLDGSEVQDKAEALGLIEKTTFDPRVHDDPHGDALSGDDWFEFSSLLSASPALPPAGGKGAADIADAAPTFAPDLLTELKQRESDIATLVAQIRWLEECLGESLEAEDAALVHQIEHYEAAKAAIAKAEGQS